MVVEVINTLISDVRICAYCGWTRHTSFCSVFVLLWLRTLESNVCTIGNIGKKTLLKGDTVLHRLSCCKNQRGLIAKESTTGSVA